MSDLDAHLAEMESGQFGPSVSIHPAYWGEKQVRLLEDYKRLHPEEYAANTGLQTAEAKFQQLQAERQANQRGDILPGQGLGGTMDSLRERFLPEAFGGRVGAYYEPTAQELESKGLLPKAVPDGWNRDNLEKDVRDKLWLQEYEKAKAEGRSVHRYHAPQATEEERLAKERTSGLEHGLGTVISTVKGYLPPGVKSGIEGALSSPAIDEALVASSPVGEKATSFDPSEIMARRPDVAAEHQAQVAGQGKELDRIESETPLPLRMAGGLLGGMLNPVNLVPKLGVPGGVTSGIRGPSVGVIPGTARGALQGAAQSVIGGQIDDAAEALRGAAQDGQDKGFLNRASEYANLSTERFPARVGMGAGLGGIFGGLGGFSKGLRDETDIRTQPLRDFESVGGSTSTMGAGGLKGTRQMQMYQDLRRPNMGNPSDAAAADTAEIAAKLAHERAGSELGAHAQQNQDYYDIAEKKGWTAVPQKLTRDALDQLNKNRYSVGGAEGDLYGHRNEALRGLIRDTNEISVMDDAGARSAREKFGSNTMELNEAVRMGLLSPGETVFVPGEGHVPVNRLDGGRMTVVIDAKPMKPRELDQTISAWDQAAKADAVRRGGPAHPMFDQLSPSIREARDQFPGAPPVTPHDVYEWDPSGADGVSTKQTQSGFSAMKGQHHQQLGQLEGDLKRIGIPSTKFQPESQPVQDAVAGQLRRYGDPGAMETSKALQDLFFRAGLGSDHLNTVRGLRLLEGQLAPESIGKSTSTAAAVAKTLQAGKYHFDPLSRFLGGRYGGVTTGTAPTAADALTETLMELQRKRGQH